MFAGQPDAIWGCDDNNRVLFYSHPVTVGPDVEELQLRLGQLGFYHGPVDGVFGEQTERAVRALQAAYRLAADGRVGPATWDALGIGLAPAVTKNPPSPSGKVEIVVDMDKRTLTITSDGQPYRTYPIAVGKSKTPSPVGEWKVNHKSTNWGGGFGTRWIGINVPWGIYGIHGTNKPWSIGSSASHGCIRMHNRHVEEIFPWITVGTRVRVVGQPKFFPGYRRRTIRPGASGQDVVLIQVRLQDMGLYWGGADGRYGQMTQLAMKYFQLLAGLPADGVIDEQSYKALGF
ncbi:hypothetical protein SY88_11135 [Clostridiales bacterium PH28_bin88]|nr:hypothetical protein SY88_11135 [Clostridiales bacterium PH28_bin88]